MGNRTYAARRRARIERLRDEAQFIANQLCRSDRTEAQIRRLRQTFSALMWALEEIARFDRIEELVFDNPDDLDDGQVIDAIELICEQRHTPSDEDLARNEGFARQIAERKQLVGSRHD